MAGNWRLALRQENLRQRAKLIQGIRDFFIGRGYLEVETPQRIPAPAPESHTDPVASGDWFLQPSPEICMKRLLAAGYEKIFQICRCWREGERGTLHIPEFTMLEWYRAGVDYHGLMEECEELVRVLAGRIGTEGILTFRGHRIDLTIPWERISVRDAFLRNADMDMNEALQRGVFDEVMVQKIEPELGVGKPTFILDYPSDRCSLARLKKDDPTVAERFELYIGGLELANAFSELVDPEEQRRRFLIEQETRRQMAKLPWPLPQKFLDEIADMPPSAGIALGVDRLIMVLINASSIDEVIAFTPEEL